MKFIKIEDIKVELKEYITDQMLDSDYSFLDSIEAAAIERVKSYTSMIVNIDYELAKLDDLRNPDLVRTIVMIMSYDIEARLTTGDVRENTLRRYNEALKYLADIQKKLVLPTWLLRDYSDSETTKSEYYSYARQNQIIY